MTDHGEWLHRLGTNRPRDAAALTQDILDRTGLPPGLDTSAPLTGGGHFLAHRIIPLLAEDNAKRAAQKAKALRDQRARQADVDDAAAENSFWQHVRDWSLTWKDGGPVHMVSPPRSAGLIPRQTRRSA